VIKFIPLCVAEWGTAGIGWWLLAAEWPIGIVRCMSSDAVVDMTMVAVVTCIVVVVLVIACVSSAVGVMVVGAVVFFVASSVALVVSVDVLVLWLLSLWLLLPCLLVMLLSWLLPSVLFIGAALLPVFGGGEVWDELRRCFNLLDKLSKVEREARMSAALLSAGETVDMGSYLLSLVLGAEAPDERMEWRKLL